MKAALRSGCIDFCTVVSSYIARKIAVISLLSLVIPSLCVNSYAKETVASYSAEVSADVDSRELRIATA